jgi:hypothetical protein
VSYIVLGVLLVALGMTLSRGPWIGFVLAASIAYVGRAKVLSRKAALVGAGLFALAVPAYIVGNQYLYSPAASEEQQAAQYRRVMISRYTPIAEYGGAFGWGDDFPQIWTMESIDNEYLRVWLIRGYLGLSMFTLLSLEGLYSLTMAGLQARSIREQHFAFTLLGCLAGLLLTIGTVYLGVQTYSLFFLLIGWSQALTVRERYLAPARLVRPAPVKRQLIKVYT